MGHWAQMHMLQIDIPCIFEHFGDPQLTKPDSEKGGQKANLEWHHLTRRIDRDCEWCDDCDRWKSLTIADNVDRGAGPNTTGEYHTMG